jgi:hypothetical protein
MDQRITIGRGETEAHTRLKRLAFVWAQRQGYSACAMEGDSEPVRFQCCERNYAVLCVDILAVLSDNSLTSATNATAAIRSAYQSRDRSMR